MTYRKLWLVGLILLTHVAYLFPAPALGMEKWRRDQQRGYDPTDDYFKNQRRRSPAPSRIDNPDQPIQNQIIDYVWGDSQDEAERKCRQIATRLGVKFNKVRRTSQQGKKWECHVLSNHPEQ